MTVTVLKTNGAQLAQIPDQTIDTTTTSLSLVGRVAINYSQAFATNFVHMLENFANVTPPSAPLKGQLWYDTSVAPAVLRTYDGTTWSSSSNLYVGNSAPSAPFLGELWYDTAYVPYLLYIYNGTAWVVVNGTYANINSPQNPYRGELWYNTTTAPYTLNIYDGTSWAPVNQSLINALTPKGSTKLSAFTSNVVANDLATTPSFTSVQQTGNFTGATYIDSCGTCAINTAAATGTEGSGTARLSLNDITANTQSLSNYVGGGSFTQGTQVSLVVPRFVFALNPTHTYNLTLVCQKGSSVGQTKVFDSYIFGMHDGTNL